jgi:hypothetical protein
LKFDLSLVLWSGHSCPLPLTNMVARLLLQLENVSLH